MAKVCQQFLYMCRVAFHQPLHSNLALESEAVIEKLSLKKLL